MKTASISELKQELQYRPEKEIMELCLRLARFKKENKELLTYLLFEANDEEAYTASVKEMLTEAFKEIYTTNLYFAKKNLRRILRQVNKNIKYSGNKQTEASLLIHYCGLLKASGINLNKSTMINNLYLQQIKKIKAAIASLHEDLQYDLLNDLNNVQECDATKA